MPDSPHPPDPWAAHDAPQVETVAERIERLEKAIAGLQKTDVMEEYVAQKVLDRLSQAPPGFAGAAGPDGLAAGSSAGALLPAGVLRAVLPAAGAVPFDGVSGLWARVPVLAELRLMVRMYFDARYRTSRLTQFGVPVVLALMVLNYLFIGYAPLVGFLVERFVLGLLAVVLYKILAREAARYAAVLHYLGRYST